MYACTFIGHHDCDESIIPKLCSEIEKMIIQNGVDIFYVGTHGSFDRIVYTVLCKLEMKYKIRIFVVLAYLKKEKESPYYDMKKTIYPEVLEKTPFRLAINKRNMYMIEQSQFMVCCVDNTFSNSYKFVSYAAKKKLSIINVGKYDLKMLLEL